MIGWRMTGLPMFLGVVMAMTAFNDWVADVLGNCHGHDRFHDYGYGRAMPWPWPSHGRGHKHGHGSAIVMAMS